MGRIVLALGILSLAAPPALADDPPPKRAEGRYFVEAAEIMLRANDFDMVMADIAQPGGSTTTEVAELSKLNLDQPKIIFGLNRPGKTTFQVAVHDFELSSERIPQTFDDSGEQIVTTPLLPPGIVFQRQRPGPPGGPPLEEAEEQDFVPNWGEEIGYIRRMDYRSMDLAVHRTAFENKSFRVRWIAGLRYAELQQKSSMRMAHAEEAGRAGSEVRDFASVQASVKTQGIGPHAGLAARYVLGEKKKWAFSGQADLAFLPESTAVRYGLSLVDTSAELWCVDIDPALNVVVLQCGNVERPLIPGLGPDRVPGDSFNAVVRQTDFTENTWLFEGTVGVRYSITRGISIGVEGWHLRWMNILTDAGVIDQIHEEATYAVNAGNPLALDPQLRDTESIIRVPRFNRREDVSFDGISFNLRFEF